MRPAAEVNSVKRDLPTYPDGQCSSACSSAPPQPASCASTSLFVRCRFSGMVGASGAGHLGAAVAINGTLPPVSLTGRAGIAFEGVGDDCSGGGRVIAGSEGSVYPSIQRQMSSAFFTRRRCTGGTTTLKLSSLTFSARLNSAMCGSIGSSTHTSSYGGSKVFTPVIFEVASRMKRVNSGSSFPPTLRGIYWNLRSFLGKTSF